MTWHYKGEIYEPTEDELKQWIGFVYIITNKNDGMKYVGKKTFWSKKTLPPLKGKTRKRRSLTQSNWKEYYGSSDLVNQLLLEHGGDIFYREILHFCTNKGEMGYKEAKEQFDRGVLLDDSYYNGIINCRVHRNHIKNMK